MSDIQLREAPPPSDGVTDYDQAFRLAYIRLLDAAAAGADWREAAAIILSLDVAADPERARGIHAAHLARAQWMARSGYRHLVGPCDRA